MTDAKRRPNRFHGRVQHADGRLCARPGCTEPGEFRAPRHATAGPADYDWLCLDHVRDHNEKWNFFSGLSQDDVARMNHRYATWDRPTWPRNGLNGDRLADPELIDIGRIFAGQPGLGRFAEKPARAKQRQPLTAAERRALADLGLDESATAQDIKWQYKALLKRYHPDTNGGDRSWERELRKVIGAYQRLAGLVGGQASRGLRADR